MDATEFYTYLSGIRSQAVRAEDARDALAAAEHRLTRVAGGATDGPRVARTAGHDALALRVHAAELVRRRRGEELHEAVAALAEFRARLDGSGLGCEERDALWCRYALGMRGHEIAEALGVPAHHVWQELAAARQELARAALAW